MEHLKERIEFNHRIENKIASSSEWTYGNPANLGPEQINLLSVIEVAQEELSFNDAQHMTGKLSDEEAYHVYTVYRNLIDRQRSKIEFQDANKQYVNYLNQVGK